MLGADYNSVDGYELIILIMQQQNEDKLMEKVMNRWESVHGVFGQ